MPDCFSYSDRRNSRQSAVALAFVSVKEICPMQRIAVLILLLSTFAVAQAPQQPSAPGVTPQHQRMGYFAGDWTASGTSKISPNTPAALFTLKEHGEWVTDGYFLETKTSMKGPLGTVNSQRVMGYNVEDKVYTYNVYNSLGEHQLALGHLNGNTWTWDSEEKLNGIIIKGRYTIVETGPDTYNFKSEVADPKGGWVTVMEGKAMRVAPPSS
jgi:hypothetical protein